MNTSLVRLAVAATTLLTCLASTPGHAANIFADASSAVEGAVQMGHLPTWVQVGSSSASLYSADSGGASLGTQPHYAFLRILNGGGARLQVEAVDENGRAGQRGWIDPTAVLPSAPGTDWLVASSATTLWHGGDAAAASGRALERFTPLQQLDGPVLGRIEVRVYSADFSAVVDQGWVDAWSTGPALPPAMRVPSPDQGLSARRSVTSQQAFLDAAAGAALAGQSRTGVPASVTVAQAILESDWGRSGLATSASNYFGIKAMGGLGNDGVVWMPTSEYDDSGNVYQTVSPFRAYKSLNDSMLDHDLLLTRASRYSEAMQAAADPRQFAERLYAAGYSTDPAYADKLIALMDRYDLYRLDS